MKKQSVKKGKSLPTKNIFYAAAALLLIAVYLLVFILPKDKTNETSDSEYMFKKEGTLTFSDSLNKPITKIDIEIADTEYDRELGLMFRKTMDMDKGMLFIFPEQQILSFWMRNTYLPLDMIFVNAEKKIVTIHKNTKILSDQSYPSSEPAQYVVEVDAGFSDRYSLKPGDKISW